MAICVRAHKGEGYVGEVQGILQIEFNPPDPAYLA